MVVEFLAAHPTAVYGEDGSSDVVACGGAEEECCSGEVLGLAPSGGGDALEDLAVAGLVGLESFGVGRREVAGSDGVDLDAPGGPLVGKGLGELGDASFGGRVGGNADASLEAEERGDVDDLAVASGDHVAGGQLRELEGAGEVDLEDALPVFESYLFGGGAMDGAGVVDEDVDAAEGGDDLTEEVLGAAGAGEVGLEGLRGAACGFDSVGGVVGGAAIAVAGYGGSGLREGDGDGGSEAAGGAGDEGYLVVETEEVEGVLHGSPNVSHG